LVISKQWSTASLLLPMQLFLAVSDDHLCTMGLPACASRLTGKERYNSNWMRFVAPGHGERD
jgi:hypothetical protein